MSDMDVRKIPGIGRMTELILNEMGITKCKHVLEMAAELHLGFKERTAEWLLSSALGISRCFHEEHDEDDIQKSISTSETFRAIRTYE